MAFNLTKKTPSAAQEQHKSAPPASAGKFLKQGAAAKEFMDKVDAEREAAKATYGKTFRFWMKPGEDRTITFLDGQIDPNTGILAIPYTNEHRVKINGNWEDIVCIENEEPCPVCAAGEKKSFVGYLTVIDHREFTDRAGKKHEWSIRLFVAKSDTLKQLTKMAEKNGPNGLAGVTYEVSRTGDKKPAVGDMFDKVGDHSYEDLVEAFGDAANPLDYDKEATVLTAQQMAELGVGKKVATIGKGFGGGFGAKKSADDIKDGDVPW